MKMKFGLVLMVFSLSFAQAAEPEVNEGTAYAQVAAEKYAEGDYNSVRDLCEMIVQRHPANKEALHFLSKSKEQLHRLSREAYFHGNILEGFNRIDEAKQYWNRALTYTRPGDADYDSIQDKLSHYTFK